jgi:hypothetical protein
MARTLKIEAHKTYATEENAVKAVDKYNLPDELRYIIMKNDEGRFFPVFIGMKAIEYGIHFRFNVIA